MNRYQLWNIFSYKVLCCKDNKPLSLWTLSFDAPDNLLVVWLQLSFHMPRLLACQDKEFEPYLECGMLDHSFGTCLSTMYNGYPISWYSSHNILISSKM